MLTDVRYCFRTAKELGITGHPQANMRYFAKLANLQILKSEPVPVADCWIFRLEGELPVTMSTHLTVMPKPYWKD